MISVYILSHFSSFMCELLRNMKSQFWKGGWTWNNCSHNCSVLCWNTINRTYTWRNCRGEGRYLQGVVWNYLSFKYLILVNKKCFLRPIQFCLSNYFVLYCLFFFFLLFSLSCSVEFLHLPCPNLRKRCVYLKQKLLS